MNAHYKKYLIFLGLLIPINIVVTVFFYLIAPSIVKTSLPTVRILIQRSFPETELANIEYRESGGSREIVYKMKITKWIRGIDIPLIDYLSSNLSVSSQFVTAIILYTLLFSWPFISMRRRLMAAVILIPFVLLFIFLDMSLSAVTSIELECQRKLAGYATQESIQRNTMIFLGHFFNNGGRQFLAALMFLISVLPFRRSSGGKRCSNAETPARNSSKKKI